TRTRCDTAYPRRTHCAYTTLFRSERFSGERVDDARGDPDAIARSLKAADDGEARVEIGGDLLERSIRPPRHLDDAPPIDHAEMRSEERRVGRGGRSGRSAGR